VRQGHQTDNLLRGGIEAILRNDVAGKRRAADTIAGARRRVVDRIRGDGKITVPNSRGRNGYRSRGLLLVAGALVGPEEEHLVPANRAAEGSAVLMVRPIAFRRPGRREIVQFSHLLVLVVLLDRAPRH